MAQIIAAFRSSTSCEQFESRTAKRHQRLTERRTSYGRTATFIRRSEDKNAQREQRNKDGAAWRRWNPTLDYWYGEVTREMLDLARIQPGQRILDIAAGAGEPAVSAAERVGPSGYVLATDISEGIVELALQVARERGLKQVDTRAMDGEKLDLPDVSFDAVLCRLGLMYMPHPVAALREWRRALKRGVGSLSLCIRRLIGTVGGLCPLPSSAGARNSRLPF